VFISLIRLNNSWFRGRLVPQLSQWVGNIGQLGQVLSAVPFAIILHLSGWTSAFLSAAALSVVAALGILLIVRDRPSAAVEAPRPASWRASLRQLGVSLKRPGTQLGFWSHFCTQSSGTVFSLMWGFPFMVFGLGYSPTLASGLLIVIVGAGIVFGPILGILTARHPLRRSNVVLGIVTTLGIAWTVVLLWPGVPPLWLMVALLVVVGAGGPGSLIGFDFARSFNPLQSLGSANGIVNVGGFLASFVMMFLIGVLLDLQHNVAIAAGSSAPLYSLDAFRPAFAVQYVVIGIGTVFLVRARRRTRRKLSEDEGIDVAPLWVALTEARQRRR
jgi:sugar phosphate permease